MMEDNTIRAFEMQDTLRRHFEPLTAMLKSLEGSLAMQQLARDLTRQQEMMRAALGPLEDLRRAALLIPESMTSNDLQRISEIVAETEKRFLLPKISEVTKLVREFENIGAAKEIARYQAHASEIVHALESMRSPWLDMADKPGSVGGFVDLQGIGHALRTMPAFDPGLTDVLRVDLGDWRKEIAWPAEIFVDPLARASFYVEHGLNPALTSFPAGAFEQSTVIAGIKETSPPLVQAYNFEPEVEEDEEEAAFERTNKAHDRLQRFETQIRRFIDKQMTAVFGENWIKHQVPENISKTWLAKRQKARDNGEPEWPLIAYADFTDYVPIIVRRDNWRKVFESIFRHKDSVQESFRRLYPIRICTMHARLITQDDELYLYVETKRLLTAIGVTS